MGYNSFFLSDLGKPGVRSLGPDVTHSLRELCWDLTDATLADEDTKGSLQIEFLEKFGNLAQPGRPPPPPPKLGPPKLKKKIDVYFAF